MSRLTAAVAVALLSIAAHRPRTAGAQPAGLAPDTLALTDLRAFRAPGAGWTIVGAAMADRGRERAVASTPGTGVLLGTAGASAPIAPISTSWEHGDIDLELEFMAVRGSRAALYLEGRYAVSLADGWGTPGASDAVAGGIDGHPPRVNAGRAPGLWQTLRISFRAPRFDAQGRKIADARFVRVEHDGLVVHENLRVPAPSAGAPLHDERATGPLAFGGGPVAVRNVRYKRYDGAAIAVAGLRYRAYEGAFDSLSQAVAGTPTRQGDALGIATALAGQPDKFALAVDGTMRVPNAGVYVFDLGFDWVDDDPQFKGTVVGGGRLTIDGREVLRHDGRLADAAGRVTLTAGDHPFALAFYKNRPWTDRHDVTLFAEGPGVARQALHAARVPDLPGAITVRPEGEAVVLRSFLWHGDVKRTHVASVGDPTGLDYSVDLQRGGLLVVWRGPFVETTDMWHDRGNDQVARPLGSTISLPNGPTLAFLATDAAVWPDGGAGADSVAFRGYALDHDGRPTFSYRLRTVDVSDRIRPAADGASLRRELRLRAPDGTDHLFVRLAGGRSIRRLADGSYLVDGPGHYVVPDADAGALVIRTAGDGQELLAPVRFRAGEAAVTYTLVW